MPIKEVSLDVKQDNPAVTALLKVSAYIMFHDYTHRASLPGINFCENLNSLSLVKMQIRGLK